LKNREIAEIFETIADLLEIKREAVYRTISHSVDSAWEQRNALGREPIDREYMAVGSAPGVGKIPRIEQSQPQPLDTFGVNPL
jgi:DNA polymerase/3'-5' exonuclease PolX